MNMYMFLGRLQHDCEYFLGFGGRSEKVLYYGNVAEQIQNMKDIYNKILFKPDWITMQDIENYEKQMLKN